MKVRFLLMLALMGGVSIARALVVEGGDGTQNTTDPGTGMPWDHVGNVGGASGVYLGAFAGGYWVATATHVGANNFTLGSNTYTLAAGSGVQISGSDLTLFRITTDPGLSNLTLALTSPPAGSTVTMVGLGVGRAAAGTSWFVNQNANPWTWSTSDSTNATTTVSGYAWAGGGTKRWGTNTVETDAATYNIGTGLTNALVTTFDQVSGQSQGAVGDSGGAVFYQNGGTWELAGIMGAIGTFSGQPGSTAVFGDATYFIDLSSYHGAIVSAIPEPADTVLWAGTAAGVMMFWRRCRRRG